MILTVYLYSEGLVLISESLPFEMEADLKAKMDADLKQRIDGLYSIKMQPSLQISSRLDFIISSIDFDAERIMFDLGEDSKKAPKAVNEARCEFVRIVKAVEQKLLSRIQANEPKKADKAFEALESRVNEFSSTTLDQGEDDEMNHLEDLYGQLVLDIMEMTNAEQRKVFGDQAIFYMNSVNPSELGTLVHFNRVSLTNEQFDCLR